MEMYLLKFSACLLIFWLVYVLVFEHQKMHQLKRFYLLGSIATALIIPLLTITYYVEPVVNDFAALPASVPIQPSLAEVHIEEAPLLSLETALWSIYGLGVILFATRFVVNLIAIYRQISKNKKVSTRTFIYVLLNDCRIPYSFFKYLFLNKLKFENNTIPQEVILHEETHAKQLHSLDIILIEVLQIVFWFHPLVYILKHHIKLNHEFLADQAVLKQGSDAKTYQNILLQFSSNPQDYHIVSTINYSSFKKRFTVMKTQTSKTRSWLSTLLLLPIIVILFYSFAEKEYVEKEDISAMSLDSETNRDSNLFLITVEKNENSIELECKSGCRWSHITLENRSEPYIINDFGFSEGQTLETDLFAFSIQPNLSGVELNGLKGTIWIDLAFSLRTNKKQAINQLGMTNHIIDATKDALKGKTLDIKAVNDKLLVNNINYDVHDYADVLNRLTKDWTLEDYYSTIPELEIKGCSEDFLDELDSEFRKSDYFLIALQGSKTIEDIQNDIVKTYAKKYEIYKRFQDTLPHYIHKSQVEQKKMEALFSDLGGMYFRMSKTNKARVKRPLAPVRPYVQITLNGKTYYKKFKDLTEEEKATLPPPPPAEKTKDATSSYDNKYETIPPPIHENASPEERAKLQKAIDEFEKKYKRKVYTAKNDKTGELINLIANDEVYEPKEIQEKPTAKQIAAYNAWARKLNNSDHKIIKKKDLDKYKRIYGLMTPEQKKNAEPFPKLPPPPDVPSILELANKGAIFYYEGNEISGKKAVELTDNNELNILIKNIESKKSIVKISKKS